MGSIEGNHLPVIVRVLDASASEAARTSAVCAKISASCADPILYTDSASCLQDLADKSTDVLIIDLETIGGDEALEAYAVRCPKAVIIAVSAKGSVSRAVSAMRSGAHDFLTKPFSLDALATKIMFQLKQRRPVLAPAPVEAALPKEPIRVPERQALKSRSEISIVVQTGLDRLIGVSLQMRDVHDQIRRMAPSQAPVFITGESGTGKELCANAIHDLSDRHPNRFVTLNCAAIPRDLIESEIFGYMRGAFTGASENRAGAAEQADGGTLFLDEIGEMDLLLQSKLLRFLQTGSFQRLGDTQSRKVDARIICATNRNPVAEITAGRFREDLYYRLHVLPVHLPPLRERRDDILPLAETFLDRYSSEERRNFKGFDADAETRILSYGWPGNVRQLENTIRQMVVMNDGAAVTYDMLPMVIRDQSSRPNAIIDLSRERSRVSVPSRPFGSIEPLWAQERRIIEDALDAFDGNIAMAAAALEISPSTIYRKRQSWTARSL
ncbi:MAG: sigma-54 dependent transcriptional regulator [Roseibium album]|uniref:Regulatory protein LuxO n=1 Tax=Roseibium album TaxID=311410 RepID=A0A0M6ZPU2_9HYPH|nr:sigma-54 dependent transcriptional regulator [Roseibium album]MBG6162186.1 two-component system repressor protein LuxO [Labrenzia sp. EL_195]MBG6174095.1 two-component system repressor protein LuxO [Labrenzia sp. EL_132]MBG6199329.1 two-component system repressor protein LuxO [Labrenzia sp. EL_13]MBG6228449.1 two-component system repressor protein LuxO [Labrenzia sp. EL_208]CTQ61045.1 Regulatory protein LuxO [Roseibium album]